jgi:hypothetical protein
MLFVAAYYLLRMPFQGLVAERFPNEEQITSFIGVFSGISLGFLVFCLKHTA